MLDYLVTSRTRRALLRLLWRDQASGSVSELARLAGMSFSTTHRELQAMCQAGLACSARCGSRVVFRKNPAHAGAELIEQLIAPEQRAPTQQHDDQVRGWLRALGAPLRVEPADAPPSAAEVLAAALALAHRDATVARVLPVVVKGILVDTDLDELLQAARRVNEVQTLGFFLHLTGQLAGDRGLVRRARGLRDHRRRTPRLFFDTRPGRHALAAARRNTPRIAKQWGLIMNMGLDSFASTFEKHA